MKVYTLVQETRDNYNLLNTSTIGVFSSEAAAAKAIMNINPNAEIDAVYDDCTIYEGKKEVNLRYCNETLFYRWYINACNVTD